MKHKIIAFFLFIFLLTNRSISWADLPTNAGPDIPDVTDFDPIVTGTVKGGKYYIGILLSEKEYMFYTNLKQRYNLLDEQLQIWQDFGNSTRNILDQNISKSKDILKDLQDLKKLVVHESWWDAHKFEMGIVLGVLVTVATVVAVEKFK